MESERQSEFEQNRKLGNGGNFRLTSERDWLIGILSKERTEQVNFLYHHSINLSTSFTTPFPILMSLSFPLTSPGLAVCQYTSLQTWKLMDSL